MKREMMTCLLRFIAVAVFAAVILFGSNSAVLAAPEQDGVIRIGGSTTLLPAMATIAENFKSKYGTWDKVDPRLPNKQIVIYSSGGGSGFGIQSTIQNTFDIGLVSRHLKEKEKKLLGPHRAVLAAKDAVVLTAHKENPLARKRMKPTKAQWAAIFSGEVQTYRDIDPSLPASRIVLFVRDSGAGSAEMLQELVLGNKQISRDALQLPSQGALLKKLESNKNALGYISSGLISAGGKLHPFLFEGVAATDQNILKGDYVLARPLLLVAKEPLDPAIDHFIRYVLTEGRQIFKDSHYVPIKDSQKRGKRSSR